MNVLKPLALRYQDFPHGLIGELVVRPVEAGCLASRATTHPGAELFGRDPRMGQGHDAQEAVVVRPRQQFCEVTPKDSLDHRIRGEPRLMAGRRLSSSMPNAAWKGIGVRPRACRRCRTLRYAPAQVRTPGLPARATRCTNAVIAPFDGVSFQDGIGSSAGFSAAAEQPVRTAVRAASRAIRIRTGPPLLHGLRAVQMSCHPGGQSGRLGHHCSPERPPAGRSRGSPASARRTPAFRHRPERAEDHPADDPDHTGLTTRMFYA